MPRSFQKRRGKPRLELQHESAAVKPRERKSRLSAIENNAHPTKKEPKQISDEEMQKQMWQHIKVSKDNPCESPLHTSQFSTKFPQHRESYIRASFPRMKKKLREFGIAIEVNYGDSYLVVSTSNRMWDPYAIIKARDMIRLVARYVPYEEAIKVMNDNVFSDIIEIGKTDVARNSVRFIKRRARLIGPNGVTLRAIELLTKCYVLVYGRTVCVIGDMKGIAAVRKIVIDCMRNVHPIYQLKRLMVQRELANNESLKNTNWDRFLPTFKKIRHSTKGSANSAQRAKTLMAIRKSAQKKRNRRYTPWPPAPVPSKIDLAMETGEYWNKQWRKENLKRMSSEEKIAQMDAQRLEKQRVAIANAKKEEKKMEKRKRREIMSKPPKEVSEQMHLQRQRASYTTGNDNNATNVAHLQSNVDSIQKKYKQHKSMDVDHFLLD